MRSILGLARFAIGALCWFVTKVRPVPIIAAPAPSDQVRLARAEAGGGCCQFGCIDNGQTSSNAMSRRRAASSWPMDRLGLDRQELKDGRVLLVRTEVRVKPRHESAGSSSDPPSIRNAPMHLKEGSVP
jgi:hypothetical protein